MKVFVTGVGGQLGHDVMNELAKRGYEGVGSDIQPVYSGVQDGTPVTQAPYISLDITDAESVKKVITEVNPDVVIHCAAWTAVDMAEDDDKVEKVYSMKDPKRSDKLQQLLAQSGVLKKHTFTAFGIYRIILGLSVFAYFYLIK